MPGRLEGKVALISGAARGQGESHARVMVSEGASVVLGDILEAEVMAVAKEIEASGGSAEGVFLDVARSEDWAVAVERAEERFGRLDVLVNNAGIITEGGAVDEPEDVWDRVIAVNQSGMFLGMKHAVPAMRRTGGGSIINVASTLGVVGAEDYIAYQASKGAIRQMTRSAALSYVGDGIRVNAICPGFIRTPMTDVLDEAIRQHDIGLTPMGRAGEAIEVSWAVVYLASDESSFVTGADLVVDGGYLAQ
jgi:NAD(P)-dependent dehydrogenase (short-subunit alcohol dehydrogenase family)